MLRRPLSGKCSVTLLFIKSHNLSTFDQVIDIYLYIHVLTKGISIKVVLDRHFETQAQAGRHYNRVSFEFGSKRDRMGKNFSFVPTRFAGMDGFLTRQNVQRVREVTLSEELRQKMTAHNYAVASRHYSYTVLRRMLINLLADIFGTDQIYDSTESEEEAVDSDIGR